MLWPKPPICSLYFFIWYNHCLLCLYYKYSRKYLSKNRQINQNSVTHLCFHFQCMNSVYKTRKTVSKKVLGTVQDPHPRGDLCQAKWRFCYLGAVIYMDAVAADATTSFPSAFWKCINWATMVQASPFSALLSCILTPQKQSQIHKRKEKCHHFCRYQILW